MYRIVLDEFLNAAPADEPPLLDNNVSTKHTNKAGIKLPH
jgi:hypothetical protein